MEGGDLLVEVLGQYIDLVLVFALVGEELDLGSGPFEPEHYRY
jgi:hypothetical protein